VTFRFHDFNSILFYSFELILIPVPLLRSLFPLKFLASSAAAEPLLNVTLELKYVCKINCNFRPAFVANSHTSVFSMSALHYAALLLWPPYVIGGVHYIFVL